MRGAALICWENQNTMWGFSKPLYGLAMARREWYGILKAPVQIWGGGATGDIAGKVSLLLEKEDPHYSCGEGSLGQCIGNNETGISDANHDFGEDGGGGTSQWGGE